jgi:hypothetical protein
MLFNYKLYINTIFCFSKWSLKTLAVDPENCLTLASFSYVVRIFRLDTLQEAKIFNYFYLSRYFLGQPAKVFAVKKYFVLGRHYYNVELGFTLPAKQSFVPLTV